MEKIPTLFARGPKHRVIDEVVPGCEWALKGEGRATRKWDGTSVLIREGRPFKRREVRIENKLPPAFIEVGRTDKKIQGWVPISPEDPADKWHREALDSIIFSQPYLPDGTYELIGPKVNRNPENASTHILVRHGQEVLHDAPRTFEGLREYLKRDIEGIVFHHPDGRMAKIKGKDFGHKRGDD